MTERGNVSVYLLFSLAASIAAGVGAYRLIRDHKPAEAVADDDVRHEVAAPKPAHDAPAPTPAPEAEPEAAPSAPTPTMSLAEQRAVDPITDPNSDASPVFGLPGIDGAIERSSVERRFRSRAPLIQRCWERSESDPGKVRVTLSVAANGHIDEVTLSDGWNEGLQACVVSLLSTMSFSGTRDGHHATVVQPIAFQATN
jgi:hypothetical protein